MKINPVSNQNYISKYNTNKISKVNSGEKTSGLDEVSFSEDAISFSKIFTGLKDQIETSSPEETSRIADIKAQVRSGEYRIDSDKIAESIISSLFSE